MAKHQLANAGDARGLSSTPESGGSPGTGNGNPLQYSCLETSMDGGAWKVTFQGLAKCWTQLNMEHIEQGDKDGNIAAEICTE